MTRLGKMTLQKAYAGRIQDTSLREGKEDPTHPKCQILIMHQSFNHCLLQQF